MAAGTRVSAAPRRTPAPTAWTPSKTWNTARDRQDQAAAMATTPADVRVEAGERRGRKREEQGEAGHDADAEHQAGGGRAAGRGMSSRPMALPTRVAAAAATPVGTCRRARPG